MSLVLIPNVESNSLAREKIGVNIQLYLCEKDYFNVCLTINNHDAWHKMKNLYESES